MRYFLKKTIQVILVLLVAGAVFFAYTYASEHLRSFVSRFSEENFGAKVSIGHVGLRLPLCLELKDVRIGDSVDIDSVRIYPSPASFLARKGLIISKIKILKPTVRIKKGDAKQFIITDFLKEKKASSGVPAHNFYLSKIQIKDAAFVYEAGKGNTLEFVKVKAKFGGPGICFSKDTNIRFTAKGFLKNKDSDFLSPLSMKGYIEPDNLTRARLQATDIKLDTLSSIYAKYLSDAIKDARINLESDIQISKNNLIAECYLEGEDITLKKDLDQKINTPFVASFILLINFKSNLVKIKNLRGNFLEVIFNRS